MDGCLYAVKCSRRRFKGESDRQKMLMEVYALAAVCDSAQETLNIVRYHQVWMLVRLYPCLEFYSGPGGCPSFIS